MNFRLINRLAQGFSTTTPRLATIKNYSNLLYRFGAAVPIFSFAYYVFMPGSINKKEE